MQNKKKILVVLQSALHVRNFIATGLVKKISDKVDITVVVPQKFVSAIEESLKESVKIAHIEEFQPNRSQKWWLALFRSASIFNRRGMNHTYNVKVRERLLIYQNRSLFWAKILLRRLPQHLLMFLLSFIFDLERLSKKIYSYFKIHPDALELIDRLKPDVVFSSTVIHETGDIEIARAAKLRGIPLVNFVASWDNLTSKGFFLIQPDRLMVWGLEDKNSAIKEHGFKENQITITGAPHFDLYFNGKTNTTREQFLEDRGLDPRKKVILFAGSSYNKLPYEPLIVEKLSEYFIENKRDDILIWYRPHPLAMRIEAIKKLRDVANIYIDEQIIKTHSDPKLRRGFSIYDEDIVHYKNLINACEGTVSFFSTMAIEFALLGKPFIWFNFSINSRSKETCSIGHNQQAYTHLQPVLKWPGVRLANNFSTMVKQIKTIIAENQNHNPDMLREKANSIAYNIDGKAQSRIINALLEK